MIIVCKEVLEDAPETAIYMLDTSLILDKTLRQKFEEPEYLDDIDSYFVTLSWDEAEILWENEKTAFIKPPQMIERLIEVWIG